MSVARYITPEERLQLLAVLPNPRDRLLVVLGLNTGFRVSELLSLKWGQLWSNGQPLAFVEVARRHLKGGDLSDGKKCFHSGCPLMRPQRRRCASMHSRLADRVVLTQKSGFSCHASAIAA
jgi:hypothetical protein